MHWGLKVKYVVRQYAIIVWVVLIAILHISCAALEARDEAYAGRDALLACDFSLAVRHFESAYRVLDHHSEVTFGYGVATILDVLNAPDVRDVLIKLGASRDVTSLCLEWKAREDSVDTDKGNTESPTDDCEPLFLRDIVFSNKESCLNESCSLVSGIDSALTWHTVFSVIEHHKTRLSLAAELLSLSASQWDEAYTLEDIFGVKTLGIHPADAFLLAALIEGILFVSEIAGHYDTQFGIRDTFEDKDCESNAAYLNAVVGLPNTDGAGYAVNRVHFERCMKYLKSAFEKAYQLREVVDRAQTVDCDTTQSLLSWTTVPYGVMDNVISLCAAFEQEPYVIQELLAPDLSVDMVYFLTHLPYRSPTEPFFVCAQDQLELKYEFLIEAINCVTTPNLLAEGEGTLKLDSQFSYRLSSGWLKWTPLDLW